MQTVHDHIYYYHQHALRAWHNITPPQYGCLLIAIAVIGWLCMKSGAR